MSIALWPGSGFGRVDEREGLVLGEGRVRGPGRGRAMPAAGLAVICPRRASQAYQLEMAASLRAALAGDSPVPSSCLAYRATCSPVTPVTGCTSCCWHQASHDGAAGPPLRRDADVAGVGGAGVSDRLAKSQASTSGSPDRHRSPRLPVRVPGADFSPWPHPVPDYPR